MKKLYYGFHFAVGRSFGRVSSYHRGGGTKKKYLFVDRFRVLYYIPAKVISFSIIPKNLSKVALVLYTNGVVSFIPALTGLSVGDYVTTFRSSTADSEVSLGLSLPLRSVKAGVRISSIELYPGFGAVVARAPGLFATVLRTYSDLVLVRLSSGEFRFFLSDCLCTVGANDTVSRSRLFLNAGYNRRLGRRPVVRGRAMNPVDHPHGGRTNGGMVLTTPWGRHVKGQKTSRSNTALRLKLSKV